MNDDNLLSRSDSVLWEMSPAVLSKTAGYLSSWAVFFPQFCGRKSEAFRCLEHSGPQHDGLRIVNGSQNKTKSSAVDNPAVILTKRRVKTAR